MDEVKKKDGEGEQTNTENKDEKDEAVNENEAVNDNETIDDESVKQLIKKAVDESLTTEKVDALTSHIVDKVAEHVTSLRSKVLAGNKPEAVNNKDTYRWLKALVSGDHEYLRHYNKTLTLADDDTAKAGYTVPTLFQAEILRLVNTYGVARRNMRYLPFGGAGNTRKIPTVATGVTATWTDELAAKTSSQPVFGLVTQTLKKLAVIVPLTEELLEDSMINLQALVTELVAEAIAKEEDTQFFVGTGSPFTGILNNTSVNTLSLGTGEDKDDITGDDLIDLIHKCPSGSRAGAKFYMGDDVFAVVNKLKDGTSGRYLVDFMSGQTPNIKGYPIEVVEVMNGITGANKGIVAFGNLGRAAILGDKGGMRVKLLTEGTIAEVGGQATVNLATQDAVALRFVERVGYVLALPGAVSVLKTGASS